MLNTIQKLKTSSEKENWKIKKYISYEWKFTRSNIFVCIKIPGEHQDAIYKLPETQWDSLQQETSVNALTTWKYVTILKHNQMVIINTIPRTTLSVSLIQQVRNLTHFTMGFQIPISRIWRGTKIKTLRPSKNWQKYL